MHALFATAVAACSVMAAVQVMRLQRAERVNEAIVTAGASETDSTLPEARFARAFVSSRQGNFEAALQGYKSLSQDAGPLRKAALYNLGNLQLREALKAGPDEAVRALPLIELAKQSYRELLRDDPSDWDARYNLERALRLAPEVEVAHAEESAPREKEERVMSTLQGNRIDLP